MLLLAGVLEAGHEFGTPSTWMARMGNGLRFDDRLDRSGDEVGRGERGHRPTADDVNGGELLEDDARLWAAVHRVELDDVSGQASLVAPGLADGVWAVPLSSGVLTEFVLFETPGVRLHAAG